MRRDYTDSNGNSSGMVTPREQVIFRKLPSGSREIDSWVSNTMIGRTERMIGND